VRLLERWAIETRYDAVLAYCSSMGQYLGVGRIRESACVMDLVDVDSQKWFDYAARSHISMRWLYRLEGRRVRGLEATLVRRAQAVTVVSTAEARLLRQLYPHAPVHVVSNGVDTEHFGQAADGVPSEDQSTDNCTGMECIFVGALDYLPNVDGITWFAREVWPGVLAAFPQARLIIVGRRPAASVRRLARHAGIEVIGEVPDVRPYVRRATLVVVPLRIARGIQNKVLEAMAAGKPVIASPQALEGLLVTPSEHVCRAATPAQWTSRILTLLSDDSERRRLAAAGQAFVSGHHQWESCLEPLEEWLGISNRAAAKSSEAASGAVALRA
jgi:sugar transferase (PEP-CTERM/EpsH1 system associated)